MMSLLRYPILMLTLMSVLGHSISINDSCAEQDWFPSGLTKCLSVSTARDLSTWSWNKAVELCPQWQTLSSIASLPVDSDVTSLYDRLVIGMSYWIGVTSSPPHTDNFIWMNGASANRSQFYVNGDKSGRLCGHVTLSTHNLTSEMTWAVDDCDLHLPYICSFDKNGTSQSSIGVEAAGTDPASSVTSALLTAANKTSAASIAFYKTANNAAAAKADNKTETPTSASKTAAATAANTTAAVKVENTIKTASKSENVTMAHVKSADHAMPETDQVDMSETNHADMSESVHVKGTELKVLGFLQILSEEYKKNHRSFGKTRRTRDSDLQGNHIPNINSKLHEPEHPSDDSDHRFWSAHSGSNSSKMATYVTLARDASVARGDQSSSSEQGTTSGTSMPTFPPLTLDASKSSLSLNYSVNINMQGSRVMIGTISTPTAASTLTSKALSPSTVITAAPATTTSAAVIQGRAPYSAEPFISSHIDTIRTILKCNTSSLADCLSSVVKVTTSRDLTFEEEQSLMASFDFLLDDLVKAGVTRDTVNIYTELREFAQILNVNIHLCGLVDSKCDEQRLNTLLAKAEDFLELVMTSNRSSQLRGRSYFSFNHLDLVMVKTAYGSIRGRTLYMKSGEITIEDIAPKSGFSSSAKTFVTAMIMHLPRSTVSLVRDGFDQVSAAVVSPVLSLKAYVEWSRVSISHTFILPATSLENDTHIPICGFQRHGYNGSQDVWDTTGCSVVPMDRSMFEDLRKSFPDFLVSQPVNDSQDGPTRVVGCFCNHTTNFAILMQIVDFMVSDSDELALSIITYIGCSVTLITQVLAITVFTCIRSLNSERVCVHRNLCITIMAAQVTFIAGVKAVEDKVLCAVVAVALHYLYSATFVWMLVEGLHLYNKVVRVFGTEKSRIIYYIFFGWGVPLVLVAISAAVDWEGYGNSRSCWLSIQRRTIWAFVGPAAAIIIVNLVILILVLRIVVTSATADKQDNHAQIRAGVKASLFLAPLLGLTWIFGLASVNADLMAFQYVFAVLNSLQGFFIFFFHCALNTEVRQALKRLRERRSLQKGDFGSSSTTSGSRPSSSDSRSSSGHQATIKERLSPLSKKINQVEPVLGCNDVLKDVLDGGELGKLQIKSGVLELI